MKRNKTAAALALSAMLLSTPAFASTGSGGFFEDLFDAVVAFFNQGGGSQSDFEDFLQVHNPDTYNSYTGRVATQNPEIDAGGAVLALTLTGGIVAIARERRRRKRKPQ